MARTPDEMAPRTVTSWDTLAAVSLVRFAVKVSPALENRRSGDADEAGTHRIRAARSCRNGKDTRCLSHHSNGLSSSSRGSRPRDRSTSHFSEASCSFFRVARGVRDTGWLS